MTSQESRNAAVAIVRQASGLAGIPPSEWTYEQRVQYNKDLAAYIQSHPTAFTAQDVATAKIVEQRAYEPLSTLGLGEGIDIFTDEFLNQAKQVTAIGGNTLRTSIYIAVAIATIFFILPYAIRAWENSKPSAK